MNIPRFAIALLASLLFAAPGFGIWGTLDKVPGATVLLPFFEVGVDAARDPHDTLPVIYNRGAGGEVIVHWEVYDRDGNAVFSGTETIPSAGTWAFSMRSLINTNASASDMGQLSDGEFFIGFMTIDAVTVGTFLPPFDANYPFRPINTLLGYAYYTRLAQGSANGLALPTLEFTAASGVHARIQGFYGADDLEEMDVNARTCAQELIVGNSCASTDDTATIRSRVFQSDAINGQTRIIVFAWDTSRPNQGGPSAICDALGTCATEYTYFRYRENADVAASGTIRLNHVVNIIGTTVGPTAPGEHLIFDIEDPGASLQLFAFSFNSASPAGNPNINWDAIFESSILP